jgi:uncharacterized paraquat-inducible protein A
VGEEEARMLPEEVVYSQPLGAEVKESPLVVRLVVVALVKVALVEVKLVKAAVRAVKREETERLVEVELVRVALVAVKLVMIEVKEVRRVEKKLEEVALVKVELVMFKLCPEMDPAEVMVAFPPMDRFPEA